MTNLLRKLAIKVQKLNKLTHYLQCFLLNFVFLLGKILQLNK